MDAGKKGILILQKIAEWLYIFLLYYFLISNKAKIEEKLLGIKWSSVNIAAFLAILFYSFTLS